MPIMYSWPGHITARMDTTTFVSSTDIVPTILEAAGAEVPSDLPGINALVREQRQARTAVYSEDFTHDMVDREMPEKSLQHRVILERPWKLIVPSAGNLPDQPVELFNVMKDPGETQNLVDQYPEVVQHLSRQLGQWWQPDQK